MPLMLTLSTERTKTTKQFRLGDRGVLGGD
jgi:hypothetical protein